MKKREFLSDVLRHVDVTAFDARPLIDRLRRHGLPGPQPGRARRTSSNRMLADHDCGVILTLAGSLFSAGLKDALALMIENNMVDAIVSTGANIVDQDFFEGLGFRHYKGDAASGRRPEAARAGASTASTTPTSTRTSCAICDMTIAEIADSLEPRAYSSREFIRAMGA